MSIRRLRCKVCGVRPSLAERKAIAADLLSFGLGADAIVSWRCSAHVAPLAKLARDLERGAPVVPLRR